jgi:hypothetical protein
MKAMTDSDTTNEAVSKTDYYKAVRENSERVVAQLEEEFADRGLKFTVRFIGSVPVQAAGHIDGERFYFRFRGNTGSIKIGPYDQAVEDGLRTRYEETRLERLAKVNQQYEAGELTDFDYELMSFNLKRPEPVSTPDEEMFLPTVVTHTAWKAGADPEDHYNGELTSDEAYDMFKHLITNLKAIPEEEQLDERTRILIYEGWEAAKAWDDRETAKIRAVMEKMTPAEQRAYVGLPPLPDETTTN